MKEVIIFVANLVLAEFHTNTVCGFKSYSDVPYERLAEKLSATLLRGFPT